MDRSATFARHMRDLTATADVPAITPRGLRHTAQSLRRAVVGDDRIMQERLGHTDIGVTLNTYTHTVSQQHRLAGGRIDALFASEPVET
jgi:integrase